MVGSNKVMGRLSRAWTCALSLGLFLAAASAQAQYFRRPVSDLDPSVIQIDEKKYLGAKLDGATPLIGEDGTQFPLSDLLGKPLILVLSYFTCDGSCSIINGQLADLLKDVSRAKLGQDYSILTLSFDKHDNIKTTAAFRRQLAAGRQFDGAWRFATFKNEEDLKAQTERIGFKFFWSPEDRVFLHPGAFLFLSAEGRLMRILYPPGVTGQDVQLAVFDAMNGQFRPRPREIINLAVSLCYSYSYKDGKYILSIPLFVGVGALVFGLTALFGSMGYYKFRSRRGRTNAQSA